MTDLPFRAYEPLGLTESEVSSLMHPSLPERADVPLEEDHWALSTLRKRYCPVHPLRQDERSLRIVRDENGEDIFVVGAKRMPRSEMLALATKLKARKKCE